MALDTYRCKVARFGSGAAGPAARGRRADTHAKQPTHERPPGPQHGPYIPPKPDTLSAVTAWIEAFVAAVRWRGFISFDFIVSASGGVHGTECNPRATSGLHFWAPEDIAGAVLDPGRFGGPAGAPVRVRPQGELQQFYSCLTETQMALFRGDGFLARLRRLATTRDVTWDRRDPRPFLTMTATSWGIIVLAIRQRRTFGEVATLDVGWYEDGPGAEMPGGGGGDTVGQAAGSVSV